MISEKRSTLTSILFIIYLLLLIGIILFKLPFYSEKLSDGIRVINLIPFHGSFDDSGAINFSEIRDNILIFIPLGIYIGMLKSNWSFMKKVLPIIGLTFAFEALQFIFTIGRSDITDILNNTLGGVIGIGIYTLLFKIFKSRTVKVVNILAFVVTVCVVVCFAQLFYNNHFVMRRLSS